MSEKTKKLIVIIVSAIISVVVSVTATMLNVSADKLLPDDLMSDTSACAYIGD